MSSSDDESDNGQVDSLMGASSSSSFLDESNNGQVDALMGASSSSSSDSSSSSSDEEEEAVVRIVEMLLDSSSEDEEEDKVWGGSRPGRAKNKNRDFLGAHQRFMTNYFSGNDSKYNEEDFEKRFRLPREVFLRIY